MTRKQGLIALVAAVVIAIGGGTAWYVLGDHTSADKATQEDTSAPAAESKGPLPTPVVVVIDKGAILRASKAGQDITRQVQGFANQARAELDPQGKALEAEAVALRNQSAGMTPEQRQARVAAFEAKRAAFSQKAQAIQGRIQTALANANHDMEKALGPILKQVMADHHANIVVDKQVVVLATDSSFDISQEVVQKLDAVLSSVHVEMPAEGAAPVAQPATP